MSSSTNESDVVRQAWKSIFRAYRFGTTPTDVHLYALYKNWDKLSLFKVLGAEYNQDGTLADIYLFHLNPLLVNALKEQDQGQTRKTLEQIQTRYAVLQRLYPESIYGSAPSWFTGVW